MRVDDAAHVVARLGGIATTAQLRAAGVHPDAIGRAVRLRSTLVRPRRGILALPSTPPVLLRAIRAGGALAATSAAEFHGLWTPQDARLHVSVRRDARVTTNARIVLHRDAHHLAPGERFLVSRHTCVRQCIRMLAFAEAVAVLDSALHQDALDDLGALGIAPPIDLDLLRRQLPQRLRPVVDAADGRAEAGAESIARTRLAHLGVVAVPQQWLMRGVRADLLVDDLVIEIGSKEFHADAEQYERDHVRAALITGLGFDYLEFTTLQVMNDWPTVEGVVLARMDARAASRQHFAATRRPGDTKPGVSRGNAG